MLSIHVTGASFLLLAKRHPRGFQEENQGEGCDKEAHSGDARCPRVLSGERISPQNLALSDCDESEGIQEEILDHWKRSGATGKVYQLHGPGLLVGNVQDFAREYSNLKLRIV